MWLLIPVSQHKRIITDFLYFYLNVCAFINRNLWRVRFVKPLVILKYIYKYKLLLPLPHYLDLFCFITVTHPGLKYECNSYFNYSQRLMGTRWSFTDRPFKHLQTLFKMRLYQGALRRRALALPFLKAEISTQRQRANCVSGPMAFDWKGVSFSLLNVNKEDAAVL